MKSIASHDNEYLYINGWGFPQNQPGQQLPTISFEEGLAAYDKDKDHMITKAEISAAGGTTKMDKMLVAAFEAFDMNRDEKLNDKDWEVFRAMMASENGLLAIKMGGPGRSDRERDPLALHEAGAASSVDAALPERALHD
jgi:hypothetical protein